MSQHDAVAVADIGEMIVISPDIKSRAPRIADTGVTVRRIAGWHRLGKTAEEIADEYGHLNLAQVHAALAYYFANQAEIDADLQREATEYERLALAQEPGESPKVGE